MKKIEGFTAVAPKIKSGNLEYCLWTDNDGALCVQLIRNDTETDNPGTHSNLIFRISDYLNTEKMPTVIRGINPEIFVEETSRDNNDAGFIKAVLKHLFRKK